MSNSLWLIGIPLLLVIGLTISASPLDGTRESPHLLKADIMNPVHVYAAGCASGIVLTLILAHFLKRAVKYLFRQRDEAGDASALYRLDHGILNVEIPPRTMWMNMGYWKKTSDFPTACRSLLDEVLKSAGILRTHNSTSILQSTTSLRLIDLGFGCGDQSIYLTQQLNSGTMPLSVGVGEKLAQYPLDNYVGLTISPSQCSFARNCLDLYPKLSNTKVQLFCADAAKPDTWSRDVHEAISRIPTKRQGTDSVSPPLKQTTWILALDSLYHFSPSRKPIFSYALKELHASIMAFDLLLSDKPSTWDLVLLRIVSLFTGTPFSNFLTVSQYKDQLMAAGYESSRVEIRDISKDVFSGMASFIEKRDRDLKVIGLGVGRYSVAGKTFGWWARSGIIKGCIVVARR